MKNMNKVDMPDAEKMELIKLKFFMDPDNPASKYSQHFDMNAQSSGSSG
jgi:hypothetical protein